jgi:hypothetical protein
MQVYIFGKTVKGMKVNGKMENSMVKVLKHCQTELFSMETGRKVDLLAKVYVSIQMVRSILAVG